MDTNFNNLILCYGLYTIPDNQWHLVDLPISYTTKYTMTIGHVNLDTGAVISTIITWDKGNSSLSQFRIALAGGNTHWACGWISIGY